MSFAKSTQTSKSTLTTASDDEVTNEEPMSIDEEISKAMRSPPKFKHSSTAVPKLSILDKASSHGDHRMSVEELEERSEEVEERLADFGV